MATFIIDRARALGDAVTQLRFYDRANPSTFYTLEVAVGLTTLEADGDAALAARLNAAMATVATVPARSSLDGREVT